MALTNSICDVPGIRVGHAQDDAARTGCTVVLPENGAVGGIDIRGSAPGTREVETLKPVRLVPQIHAVLLTGGSAFGLDATGGVQQFLEENGVGYDVGVTRVPIVPSAVIFDLREGDCSIRPDREMGYRAAAAASAAFPGEGRIGAGRGATVGKMLGHENCMKGGIGTAGDSIAGVSIGVLAVVNALGDVRDPESRTIIAGARDPDTGSFVNAVRYLRSHPVEPLQRSGNTTLVVVATDARLSKDEATKVAQMAQDGLGRSVYPAHTPYDGDIVFGLSVGEKNADVMALGAVAAELTAQAIVRGVRIANGLK